MGFDRRSLSHKKSTAHVVMLEVENGRLKPEKGMPTEEAAVWHSIVNAMPAGYFNPATAQLLKMLCEATITADTIAAKLAETRASGDDLKRLDYWSEMHARMSRTIADLSTKLRLTPRSRYSPEQTSHKVRLKASTRPWEAKT